MQDDALHEENSTPISPTTTQIPSSSVLTVTPAEDRNKTSRQPRWSRQETFILIQGKKIVENNHINVRTTTNAIRSPDHQHEPKWDSISSYCIQHGAIKTPAQCRKKWDHLAGDFRKIKTWEFGTGAAADGSYWTMRGEARKEKRLPGSFDREVFDALNGKGFNVGAVPLALFTSMPKSGAVDEVISDFEETGEEDIGGARLDELSSPLTMSGTEKGRNPCSKSEHGGSTKRRRRSSSNKSADPSAEQKMIRVLERNNEILNAQIEAQKIAGQLDRAQRRYETKSLVSAIGKISDALVNIVNKL